MEPFEESGSGVIIRIKVVPGGSRNEIVGRHADRVRVKVSAPPEGGKANKAVVALIAEALGAARRAVTITHGHGTPRKTVQVDGVDAATVGRLLYGEGA